MANFPSSFDDTTSLFGDLADLIVMTITGSITYSATSMVASDSTMAGRLANYTELVFQEVGSGPATFTGGGLNDLVLSGTYTGKGLKTDYRVQIDSSTSSPDTFKWSRDGGTTWVATLVPCKTLAQGGTTLENGLNVYFGAVDGHTVGNYWSWSSGFEIVRVTNKSGTTLTISRGYAGSVAMAHSAGAVVTQDPLARHIIALRDALYAAQKYAGLVGTDAAKPATCSVGQVYVATDTAKVYVCLTTNTWSVFALADHGLYGNLSADDHTQYHTDARKATWHTNLPGDHLTTIAHNHNGTGTQGSPVKKFRTGLLASLDTAAAAGQVYFARDTGDLYFSPNGSTWERYSVVPVGTIMFFTTACPSGWEAATALANKFPKGADTGEWAGLSAGGEDSHTHSLPVLINHTHTISSQSATSAEGGAHSHSFSVSSGGGASSLPYDVINKLVAAFYTSASGSHTHTVTLPAINTQNAGSVSALTEGGSNLPPYYQLVACRKV